MLKKIFVALILATIVLASSGLISAQQYTMIIRHTGLLISSKILIIPAHLL